ncbi:unnamed protein product [Amoebophrya sp. A25]|nr:unnamed protein product [Amoebophrya sp. A25]|eukprot:GSA25T00017211001.1
MVSKSATIPIKLLFEAIPHPVTVELKNGDKYRGKLVHCEESMNCLLENVTKTLKTGEVSTLEQVHLRGSQVRLFTLPELLKHARILKGGQAAAAAGRGRGRNVAAHGAKVAAAKK